MWKRVLNRFYWLERDEEFRWLQAVRAAVCAEEGKRLNREEEQGEN